MCVVSFGKAAKKNNNPKVATPYCVESLLFKVADYTVKQGHVTAHQTDSRLITDCLKMNIHAQAGNLCHFKNTSSVFNPLKNGNITGDSPQENIPQIAGMSGHPNLDHSSLSLSHHLHSIYLYVCPDINRVSV